MLIAFEVYGPFVAERKGRTPWHPHHIAERYGLLVIITLGEVILGTVAALNALVHGEAGWTVDAALLAIAGVGLTFGCWWMYFAVPWAEPLVRHRERGFIFGYGHLVIFGRARRDGRRPARRAPSPSRTRRRSARPARCSASRSRSRIYVVMFYALYSVLMRALRPVPPRPARGHDRACWSCRSLLAAAGVSMAVCLLVLALAPAVTVVGYETSGTGTWPTRSSGCDRRAPIQKPSDSMACSRAGSSS